MAALVAASGCELDSGSEEARDERAATGEDRAGRASAVLVKRLRRGGYVVAFRHAATDSGMDTTNDFADCSRQRNLSAEGRRQSRSIGRAFERLGIPVGRVLASPFCRTRDTARLAFDRVRSSRALLSVEFFANPSEGRRKGLRRLLAIRPRRGTNTVLVSHSAAIYEATEVDAAEGDAVIAAPRRGRRGFTLLSIVTADQWGRMAGGRVAEPHGGGAGA